MKLATTTGDFDRFCPTYTACLENIAAAGFKYIDLSMYSMTRNADLLTSADYLEIVDTLKSDADRLGLTFVQSHSPGGSLASSSSAALFDATIRSVEICGLLGIPNIVVHLSAIPGASKDEFFEKNREIYRRLLPTAEKHGVNILIENTTKLNVGAHYYPTTGEDMRLFCEFVDHPLLHACWDTGHGNCEGGQYEQILAMGDHLRALHVNDNRGGGDEHLIPYLGTLNLDDLMNALIDSGYKGYFTFESGSVLRPSKYWLGNRHEYAKNTALADATLEMQQDLERLMYHVGVHALTTYGCFEE